jgi:lysophospholipase L1-like esterase
MLFSSGDSPQSASSNFSGEGFDEVQPGESPFVVSASSNSPGLGLLKQRRSRSQTDASTRLCSHAAQRQNVRLQVVDYHAVLVAADGEQYIPGLTVDGVHPDAAGYAVMAPLVEQAIAVTQGKR